jgi:hypothetical protein
MKINAYFFVLLLILCSYSQLNAQENDKKQIKISDLILFSDSLKQLPLQNTLNNTMLLKKENNTLPSSAQFKQAFINLKLPKNSDYEIAMKNLAMEELKERIREYKMDASLNYKNFIEQQTNKLYYAGQYPPNNLLNIFSWVKFIKALQNGDLKIKD